MKIIFIACLSIICLLAWNLHQHLFLSWDVSAILLETEKLLQGGNYINDFFTPNSPMIMYLYSPAVIFSHVSHVSLLTVFPLYIFAIAALSFYMSYRLTAKIFPIQDNIQRYAFLCVIAVVFLIVPLYEFGQRDHLLVLMTMPYLLATACRLEGQPISRRFAIAIGLFAGLGIAIKPQFLILPILIEAYYSLYFKSWLAWIKPATKAIIAVQVLYVILVLITRQDYIHFMLPYLMQNYYQTSAVSWYKFLFNDSLLYIYIALMLYILLHKITTYKTLSATLFIALIAFTITYLSQGFTYFYHVVPALSLAILMLMQLYINIAAQEKLSKNNYILLTLVALYVIAIVLSQLNMFFAGAVIAPVLLFGLSAVLLFNALLFFNSKSKNLFHRIFATLLGALFFVYPAWIEANCYGNMVQYKGLILDKLVAFIHTQPPHTSIYTLSPQLHYTFPLASYTDVEVAQRFDALWMFRNTKNNLESVRNNKDKAMIVNMIVDDFNKQKPDIIFVEREHVGQTDYFDILSFLLENKEFHQIWQNYSYITTIEQPGLFTLDLYKKR